MSASADVKVVVFNHKFTGHTFTGHTFTGHKFTGHKFSPIKPPKKESLMISKLRQLCLDLPEDPSCGGYLFEDWTLYELMTSPLQPYKKLKRVKC